MNEGMHITEETVSPLTYGERLSSLRAAALEGEEVDLLEAQLLLDDLQSYDANRMMTVGSRAMGDETQATINYLSGLLIDIPDNIVLGES